MGAHKVMLDLLQVSYDKVRATHTHTHTQPLASHAWTLVREGNPSSLSLCTSAERQQDAGDHQVHPPVPAEVLQGEPGDRKSVV